LARDKGEANTEAVKTVRRDRNMVRCKKKREV
jgi:hypothetical protein